MVSSVFGVLAFEPVNVWFRFSFWRNCERFGVPVTCERMVNVWLSSAFGEPVNGWISSVFGVTMNVWVSSRQFLAYGL